MGPDVVSKALTGFLRGDVDYMPVSGRQLASHSLVSAAFLEFPAECKLLSTSTGTGVSSLGPTVWCYGAQHCESV